jgi:hypothetical protein
MSKTLPANQRVGIFDRSHDANNPGLQQCVGTWWRSSMVRMRFKRNIRGPAPSAFQSLLESDRLRMLYSLKNVAALTDNLSVLIDNYTAHQRSGAYPGNPHSAGSRAPSLAADRFRSIDFAIGVSLFSALSEKLGLSAHHANRRDVILGLIRPDHQRSPIPT